MGQHLFQSLAKFELMKVLILGASGRTGKLVLEQALSEGYLVNVLVRDARKIKAHPRLQVREGNPANLEDLQRSLVGCKAVISVLNISRSSDFPWAPVRTPKDYMSTVMRKLLSLSLAPPLERLIVCSAWGVGDSRANIPFWFRWTIDLSNIRVAYADHARQEKLVESSDLSWTIVRPVGLSNSRKGETIQLSYGKLPKPSLLISRKTLAQFLVSCLSGAELDRKTVVVSKK